MFDNLSEKQREIVFDKSGKFVVRACPGSGKTYCVSARLARLILGWKSSYQGIAAISFTNVAWQEIEKKYYDEFRGSKKIGFPHFVGTIDSFINKFIFLPYGHLVLKCKVRPTLVGEPHGIWTGKYFSDSLFDNISYTITGEFYAHNPRKMPGNWETNKNIVNSKKNLNKAGFATQSDANYFAMRILEGYPQIARAIAIRFPCLILDEAQDTSDIQMRIMDLLIKNGLGEVMLVGDPDQAIFEWNNARPDLFNQKFNEWGENSVVLNESRRSSQLICNSTFNISSLPSKSIAIDPAIKDFSYKPKIVVYSNDLPALVSSFIDECISLGIECSKDNISVIYRASDLINDITGTSAIPFNKSPWVNQDSYTRDFAKGKYLYDKGDFKGGFKLIEKALAKHIINEPFCSDMTLEQIIEKTGFAYLKSFVFDFVQLLPKTDIDFGAWVDATNSILKNRGYEIQLKISSTGRAYSFSQVFLSEDIRLNGRNYRIGTVHSVKGETFDATLLVLKKKGIGKYYTTLLNQSISTLGDEELRIAYVGMTRPRRMLVLAVPDEENKLAWEKRLL